ncbi:MULTISPECIES: hypothetical protein [unclassified Kitasatospora]|uniref:hypothetical protein n=1 Tax=unclassified Kitasatospora TaxID=2633591 RepID=UPI0033CC3B2E
MRITITEHLRSLQTRAASAPDLSTVVAGRRNDDKRQVVEKVTDGFAALTTTSAASAVRSAGSPVRIGDVREQADQAPDTAVIGGTHRPDDLELQLAVTHRAVRVCRGETTAA